MLIVADIDTLLLLLNGPLSISIMDDLSIFPDLLLWEDDGVFTVHNSSLLALQYSLQCSSNPSSGGNRWLASLIRWMDGCKRDQIRFGS